ncbi:MAG TPA: PAS domain S-box protein [Gemmatimonadaceae bacterium]|nr:PAS domain S-box protein [Gemmatimonadaceae bacterium]
MNFWAVFESAPDAYLLLAPDAPRFTMVAANEARLRATMTRREDVLGRPLFEVFPDNPTDPAATGVRNLRASLDEVIRTGKPHRMALQKYDIRRPDGSFEERYWDPLNAPVFDDRGRLIYIVHRVEDVTEQVRTGRRLRALESAAAESARQLTRETAARLQETKARREVEALLSRLRDSEERYRLLVDMIPQNIWTTDAAGQHTFFSRGWYEFTGASPEESHGEAWIRFIHPEDRERMLARWHHSLETGEPYEIEYRFRDAGGTYHWFLGRARPLRDEAGEIVEWFGTATDISERKRLDEERERLLAREREAREQVTTILESITDGFFAVDREWRFTYANREAERLLRRSREALVGRTVWAEFPAAVGASFEREYHRAMAEGTTVHFEEHFAPLDTWFDVHAYPSDAGLSVFFRDVTARKRAEKRLRESEERYRLLADLIPQSIWTTDPQGYHGYFSRRWYDFTGATHEETKGTGWLDFLHPDDRERTIARWEHSLRTGERYSVEYRFRNTTGEYCWFWGQAVPQRSESGEIVQWIGTLTDISARKQHEEERERLLAAEREARAEAERRREELERVTESRTRLMRGFSHDVKNPLGAADGFAALLEEGIGGELSEPHRRSVQRIRRSIQTSLRLIDDLLELARAEAGQVELKVQRVDVAELVQEIAEDFRGQVDAAGLALEVLASDSLPVESDAARVRQILSNLVSNAAKYTHEGRVMLVACRRTGAGAPGPGAWTAIEVTDTGPGIPPEKHETIFQEFTRLDPDAPHGAGVGLAISRRIARLLGGDVTVESEVGRGATFTLWLPPSASM